MSESFVENYKAKHKHPLNKLTHSIGIPMIVISLPLFCFNWRWALGLFIVGWILQFVGHAIEGNQPAFFKNPDQKSTRLNSSHSQISYAVFCLKKKKKKYITLKYN